MGGDTVFQHMKLVKCFLIRLFNQDETSLFNLGETPWGFNHSSQE